MKKIALIAAMAFLPFFAQAQVASSSCVAQVLKNDRNGVKAHAIIACGSQTISVNEITSFDQMGPDAALVLKSQLVEVLKGILNQENLTCFENDSEIFWIGICHK